MKTLSIDVGPSRFTLAEGNVVGQEVRLSKLLTVELPMGSIADGIVADQSSLRSALEMTLKANRLKTKQTLVTVSSNAMIMRKLEVPYASEKDTHNLVTVEMQQFLPSGRKFMIDYVAIGESVSAHGGKMSVVKAAALPSELCEGYYRLLESVGLKPQRMDVHPQVLGRVFSPDARVNDELIGGQPIIAIELAQYQTTINVLIDGEVDLSRSLPVGISNLERTLADRMQTTPEEARKYIREKLDFAKDDDEGSESAKRYMGQTLQEVRKVQQYLRTKNFQSLPRVYLYGIGSGYKGLDAYFSENLELTAETVKAHNRIFMPMEDKVSALSHFLNAAGAMLKS